MQEPRTLIMPLCVSIIISVMACLITGLNTSAQEIGANFNHNPENIEFAYLKKTNVEWIRTTPRIFEFINGDKDLNDSSLLKIIEASQKGYKIAFGFRWDFKKLNTRIPTPDSEAENQYFECVTSILEKVGPHISIFTLGNEPNLETLPQDMQLDSLGIIPLVQFTKRLYTEVLHPFYSNHPQFDKPEIYVGSFPRLFMKETQANPAVCALLQYTNESSDIAGLSVHLHISKMKQVAEAMEFARSKIPDKPIIVPEFSLHRLYVSKLSEPINNTKKGSAFLRKHNYDTAWKSYNFYTHANTHRVKPNEWEDFFTTREWFPEHYLKIYYKYFQQYGVILATYPILQQYCPKTVDANSKAWFINPVFLQNTLILSEEGMYTANPLCFDDFIEIVEQGKLDKD